ncbi:SDR family oxidoreductase, partial [Candidatus Zixiibacteriota bacterium]
MTARQEKPKILITGSNGLLGQKMAQVAGADYWRVGVDLQDESLSSADEYLRLDITGREEVLETIARIRPAAVINTAALTNVDACEKERELAWAVNVEGVRHLLEACQKVGGHLIHLSSDYVFDGEAGPYEPDAEPNPLGYYGLTKLESEKVVAGSPGPWTVVRTNVLYGWAPQVRANFALWVHSLLSAKKYIRAAIDQYGNPTLVDNLAEGILSILRGGHRGIFHIAGGDYMSRWAFALKTATVFEFNHELIAPVLSSKLSQRAPRPHWGGLRIDTAVDKLGFVPLGVQRGLEILKAQMSQKEMEV